ncbi:hypothetical protein RMATCC62417_12186 [Rhizopus microsporus]|nr:hypothetical protein RMATCC62417_12186 [Rhizopus microsporus]
MKFTHSFTYISACILLLQQSVSAVPLQQPGALVKRGSGLHGKFLHITDIHLDPYYKEGADPSSLCHRHGKKRSKESGKYGALGTDCDTPVPLVQIAFDFLKEKVQDVDFILYTGDTARHDRDDDLPISDDDIVDSHQTVLKYFQSAYSTKHTPYIPTIGNNDGFDHNDLGKKAKIFTKLESIWKPLGLNLTHNFAQGGYFAQDILDGKLTVINTNSMYFFKKDDASDCDKEGSPGTIQLKWLESTLDHYARKDGNHQVYLMGHVPPVDDDGSKLFKDKCYSKYIDLLGKHSKIIAGHFTGHTNNDNLNAIVSDDDKYTLVHAGKHNNVDSKTAVGLFNAPSIIPKNNPAIRVYKYQAESGKYPVGTVLDWEQYYLDLEKANNDGDAKFELEYTASDLFGVDHFDGAGVAKAMNAIADNKKIRKLYKKYAGVST